MAVGATKTRPERDARDAHEDLLAVHREPAALGGEALGLLRGEVEVLAAGAHGREHVAQAVVVRDAALLDDVQRRCGVDELRVIDGTKHANRVLAGQRAVRAIDAENVVREGRLDGELMDLDLVVIVIVAAASAAALAVLVVVMMVVRVILVVMMVLMLAAAPVLILATAIVVVFVVVFVVEFAAAVLAVLVLVLFHGYAISTCASSAACSRPTFNRVVTCSSASE